MTINKCWGAEGGNNEEVLPDIWFYLPAQCLLLTASPRHPSSLHITDTGEELKCSQPMRPPGGDLFICPRVMSRGRAEAETL